MSATVVALAAGASLAGRLAHMDRHTITGVVTVPVVVVTAALAAAITAGCVAVRAEPLAATKRGARRREGKGG